MLVSLIAAIVAALLYGIAAVMQAIAVRAASNKSAEDASGGVDPGLVKGSHGLAATSAQDRPLLIGDGPAPAAQNESLTAVSSLVLQALDLE